MTARPKPNSSARVVMGIHQPPGVSPAMLAYAVVSLDDGALPKLIEARELNAAPSALAEVIQRCNVRRIVRVVHAPQTIVRAALIPKGPAADMAAAAALLGESQLPESIPAHRRACAPVPDVDRPQGTLCLLTAWREGAQPAEAPTQPDVETTYIAEAAALAMLKGDLVGVSISADRRSGAITIIAAGNEKAIARSLIESAATTDEFSAALDQLIRSSLAAVGLPPSAAPAVPSANPAVLIPSAAALSRRVTSIPTDAAWLSRFGLPLGAALDALSPDSAPLAALTLFPPRAPNSPIARIRNTITVPRRAAGLLAAAVAIMLLAPWAFAELRLAVLNARSSGLGDRTREVEQATKREAMHRQFESSRWPMTKLLGDVSRAAPVGVTLDTLSIAPDQGLTLQGTAPTQEVLNQFLANLNASRVFTSARINRVETNSGVEFQMSAAVSSPHSPAAGSPEDFAAKPLAVRLYGEGASNTTTPVATASAASDSAPSRAERATTPRPSREPSSSSSSTATPAPRINNDELPPVLTDDQINTMPRTTAMLEMVKRRTYPQKNRSLDAGEKSRLESEVKKLQEHIQRLNSSGSAGGGSGGAGSGGGGSGSTPPASGSAGSPNTGGTP
jgi:Tfp pilus assembly protein PilN